MKEIFSNVGWAVKNPFRQARSHFGSVAFDGKVYVFGGGGRAFEPLDAVEIYDPLKDLWTEGRPMPTRRSGVTAVAAGDKVYVMGGGFKKEDGTFEFLKTVEIYDSRRDRWEKGPDLIMRHDAPSATFFRNKIYLFGGHHPDAKGGPLTDPAFSYSEVLNLESGCWEEISPMPTPRFSLAAVTFQDRILAMGGGAFTGTSFTNFDCVEVYSESENRWKPDQGMTLPWPAAGIGACVLDHHLFVFGGNDGEKIQDRAAYFDLEEKRWRDIPPMPYPRVIMGVVAFDRTVYLLGGRGPDGKQPVDTVMELTIS